MLCQFLMAKIRLEMSLMMIDTTTALPDEGKIQNKDDRPVIVFSAKRVRKLFCRFLMEKLGS